MKSNMGTADRVIRTVLALAVGALWYTGRISGTVAIVLGAMAVIFLRPVSSAGARPTRRSASPPAGRAALLD